MADNVIQFSIEAVDHYTKTFKKVTTVTKEVVKKVGELGVAVTGAATAFVYFMNRVNEAMDEQVKFAQRLGVSVQQLTALQHAARLSGVDVNAMNLALQRMTRRVGEAAQGTGEAKLAIAQLGLDAREFGKLPLGQQMTILADKFSHMTDRSQKLRLAFKLFDSEGVSMLQILQQGGPAMQSMIDDAERLGVTIDKKTAAQVAAFTSQWDRLKGAMTGVTRSFTNEVTPVMTGVFKEVTDQLANLRQGAAALGDQAVRTFLTMFVYARQIFKRLGEMWSNTFNGNLFADSLLTLWATVAKKILQGAAVLATGSAKILTAGFQVGMESLVSLGVWAFVQLQHLVPQAMHNVLIAMGGYFQLVWEGFVDLAKAAWHNVIAFFKHGQMVNLGDVLFKDIPERAKEVQQQINDAFLGIEDTAPDLGRWVTEQMAPATEAARKRLADTFHEALGAGKAFALDFGDSMGEVLGINTDTMQKQVDDLMKHLQTMGAGVQQQQKQVVEGAKGYWAELADVTQQYMGQMRTAAHDLAQGTLDVMMNMVDSVSQGVAQAIMTGASFAETFKQILNAVLQQTIALLIKVGLQRLVLSLINKTALAAEASGEMAQGLAQTYVNAFKSTAAIPIIGPELAPGVAAASVATAAAGAQTSGAVGSALGAQIAGVGHAGLTDVPREGTYLLNKGERVVAPRQNEDLTRFLRDGGAGYHVTMPGMQLHVNITGRDLESMSPSEVRDLVAKKLIPALDQLDRSGIRPRAIERTGR